MRSADIAIIREDKVTDLDGKYLDVAPEIVIEIDTKADLKEVNNPLGYYQEKTDELIQFGVLKVVWIFTETRKVMIAEKDSPWKVVDWSDSVEIKKGLTIALNKLMERKPRG